MSADNPDRLDEGLANGETYTAVSAVTECDGDAGRAGTGDTGGPNTDVDRAKFVEPRHESARLRQRCKVLREGQYRQTAVALTALGVAGLLSGALFPPICEALAVPGIIRLFAATVTRYPGPERLISVGVDASVFGAHAGNHAAVVDELELQDAAIYTPNADHSSVRLSVPEHRACALPDAEAPRGTFVIIDDKLTRGVAFNPSGGGLFNEFEWSLNGPLGNDPETLARQTTSTLMELFELAGTVTAETGAADGRLTVRVEDCRLAVVEVFDTPVAPSVAVVVAHGLDTPVIARAAVGEEMDFAVTYRWEVGDDEEIEIETEPSADTADDMAKMKKETENADPDERR